MAGELVVKNGLLSSVAVVSKTEADSPYSVTINESGTVFTNSGATGSLTFQLPDAAPGLKYTFVVMAAQSLNVLSQSGDSFRLEDTLSAGGSYDITSSSIGDAVTVAAINATEWLVTSYTGTWTVSIV